MPNSSKTPDEVSGAADLAVHVPLLTPDDTPPKINASPSGSKVTVEKVGGKGGTPELMESIPSKDQEGNHG